MLSSFDVFAVLPAADLKRAKDFYRDKLELEPSEETGDSAMYRSGANSTFLVYETSNAGTAQNTAMCWFVDDLEAAIAHLRGHGVVFEEYDFPGLKTENAIATSEVDKTAWFRDSEGNYLCLSQRL